MDDDKEENMRQQSGQSDLEWVKHFRSEMDAKVEAMLDHVKGQLEEEQAMIEEFKNFIAQQTEDFLTRADERFQHRQETNNNALNEGLQVFSETFGNIDRLVEELRSLKSTYEVLKTSS